MVKGVLLALLAALSWGSSMVMSKSILAEIDAGALFFYQIVAATLLSWIVLIKTHKHFSVNKRSLLAYSTGVFEPFLAYILTLYGLKSVPAGIASIIFSMESVFILILSVFILKMKIKSPGVFVFILVGAMAGSLMVVMPNISHENGGLTGYLLVLVGVMSASFYVVISSKLVDSFEPIELLTGQLTFSLILAVPFILISGGGTSLSVETGVLITLSGMLQYFLAFFLYLHALRWIQVYIAGVILYFIPLIAILLSWLFLKESISPMQFAGIILTVSSVYILNKKYGH